MRRTVCRQKRLEAEKENVELFDWPKSSFIRCYGKTWMNFLANNLALALKANCVLTIFQTISFLVKVKVTRSCPTLWDPWNVAHQAPLSMEFSSQEYLSRLPCPPPGDLPDPGTEPRSPVLRVDSLLSEPPAKLALNTGSKNISVSSYSCLNSIKAA